MDQKAPLQTSVCVKWRENGRKRGLSEACVCDCRSIAIQWNTQPQQRQSSGGEGNIGWGGGFCVCRGRSGVTHTASSSYVTAFELRHERGRKENKASEEDGVGREKPDSLKKIVLFIITTSHALCYSHTCTTLEPEHIIHMIQTSKVCQIVRELCSPCPLFHLTGALCCPSSLDRRVGTENTGCVP